jgi:hypothetical protein
MLVHMTDSRTGAGQSVCALMTQLLSGLRVGQAVYVVTKPDIATLPGDGRLSVADLASRRGAPRRPLAMLELLNANGDLVETTALGATSSRHNPPSLAAALVTTGNARMEIA